MKLTDREILLLTRAGFNERFDAEAVNHQNQRACYETLEKELIDIIGKWITEGATDSSCTSSGHPCDTSNVTYSQTIQPILNTECLGCHTVAADTNMNVDLSSYEGVRNAVESGQFYGSVTHSLGYSPMPSVTDTLTRCEILQIRKWIDTGAQNN